MGILRGRLLQAFVTSPKLRRTVTRLLYGDHDKLIDVCGTPLTINTIKENGYLRASKMGESSSVFRDEISVMINLASVLAANDTFVDVGANVGLYTHTFSRLRHLISGFSVYAFEANPDTYRRLVAAIDPAVIAKQIALASKPGTLQFVEGAVSHVFTTSNNANMYNIAGKTIDVPAMRLDACEINGNSLVIKIDVEGQELDVLQGATGLIDAGRVKAVYLDGYADRGVETLLSDRGFALFDGRTLQRITGNAFSLLALHPDKYPIPAS